MENGMESTDFDETAVFLVHMLKQSLYGFDRLDEICENCTPGSPIMAFYLNSIYNYTALLFLLDKKNKPMGGTVYPILDKYGLADLLTPVRSLLERPLGNSSFGEIIRNFRNKVVVHTQHRDADLDPIYRVFDISVPANQAQWQKLLHNLREEIISLTTEVVSHSGRPLADFGISTD